MNPLKIEEENFLDQNKDFITNLKIKCQKDALIPAGIYLGYKIFFLVFFNYFAGFIANINGMISASIVLIALLETLVCSFLIWGFAYLYLRQLRLYREFPDKFYKPSLCYIYHIRLEDNFIKQKQ